MSPTRPMRHARPLRFDVAVLGGGPAAVAAALVAQGSGTAVGLIAPQPKPESGPLELLAGRAGAALDALGLADQLSLSAETSVGIVCRWAGTGFDEQTGLLNPDGGGWVVDRARFDAALRRAAAARGVVVVEGRVVSIDSVPARPARIRFGGGEVVADEVVVAVGRSGGPVRNRVRRDVRHRIVALHTHLAPGSIGGLGRRLLIDRAPGGWWYALSDSSRTHVAFCTDAALLVSGAAAVAATWTRACESACDWLPAAARSDTPRVRPATVGAAAPVVDGPVRLAGDVALAVDPLSGHGVTLALQAGSRCRDTEYADWAAEAGRAHERMERELYGAAVGVDGPFWDRRRKRSVLAI